MKEYVANIETLRKGGDKERAVSKLNEYENRADCATAEGLAGGKAVMTDNDGILVCMKYMLDERFIAFYPPRDNAC